MNKSDTIEKIAPALHKAQGQIKAALKDSTNPHFRSKYADLGSVIEAVKPALQANGITFLQGIHDAVDGVAVETLLLHTSGEWISSTMRVPAVKQDAQGYGSAITYGRRYGLQSMCGVPAEDDDGNAATASTSGSSGTITPTTGARERVATKRREVVEDTAILVKDALAEERDFDAYAHCENFTDPDEKVYLWTFLDSKQRARLKAQAEVARGGEKVEA
jgi:hypothetical protein